MTYEDFHNEMGHCGNDLIASTAKAMIQKTKILKESKKCSTVKGE